MNIKELELKTRNMEAQIEFYQNKIGLKLIDQSESTAVFQIGKSRLKLMYSEDASPYHYAINIPSNKEVEALDWLKSKVEILKDGSNEIQDFDFWNAKAIYFYDMDLNIVEFIARKNLGNDSNTEFDVDGLLEISEIGIPVSNVEEVYNKLHSIAKLERYSGNLISFCAIGDEHGLFICIDKNSRTWFPIGDTAYSSDFRIKFEHSGHRYDLEFRNEVLHILKEVEL
jgi:catechol-2,3-dioxygenase